MPGDFNFKEIVTIAEISEVRHYNYKWNKSFSLKFENNCEFKRLRSANSNCSCISKNKYKLYELCLA